MTTPARPQPHATPVLWWIRVQHDEVQVLQQREAPHTAPVKGERLAYALGPFMSKDKAQARADDLYKRTHKAQMERMGL